MEKTYTLKVTRFRAFSPNPSETTCSGTFEELKEHFKYTLECGHAYDRKVNVNPKTIKSLISNVEKAVIARSNGSSSYNIELVK